jgi:hypothetical protein
MGRQSDAGRFVTQQEWLWPIVELAEILLFIIARTVRHHTIRLEAKAGIHGNHTMCRHGKAVNW